VTLQPREKSMALCSGDLFDMRAEIEVGEGGEFSILLRGEPVTYSATTRQLACLGKSAELQPVDGRVRLQILLDRASIEVFGNDGRVSLTSCFVPDALNKQVEIHGCDARIDTFKAHELHSAWR
jgi:sucrose-6-phosphate hydrolase SacC (GH32 family)